MVFQSDVVQTLGRSSARRAGRSDPRRGGVGRLGGPLADPYGRQIYAIGADPDAAAGPASASARSASRSSASAVCAAIGALISVSQVGAASVFGFQKVSVIAAAVLGGTSLFGGAAAFGSIFGPCSSRPLRMPPVGVNADPYLYPLVNAFIIFIAAWVDGRRTQLMEKLEQRKIRIET